MRINQKTTSVLLLLVLAVFKAPVSMALEHASPLRLWGSLSTTYRERNSADDVTSSSWLNTGSISASSYIWRPWFATVGGSLSLSVEDLEGDEQQDATDEFATGDLRFNVFPTSRFPFRAYYTESREELDSDTFETNVRTTEYGVSQAYRSTDGRHNYLAEYDNDDQQFDNDARFVSDIVKLSASNRLGDHIIDTDIDLEEAENLTIGERAESDSLTIEHNYATARTFSTDNLFSQVSSESELDESRRDFDASQISTFVSWRPTANDRVRVTGAVRATENQSREERLDLPDGGVEENESKSVNLNQGLVYEYDRNLQFSESMNVSQVDNNGLEQLVASEAVSARYAADRREISLGDYGWSASTSFINRHGDIESERSLNGQFNHSLGNDFSQLNRYRLRTDLTQSVGYDYEATRQDEKNLDHSFSMIWSQAGIANQNQVRLFVSDSRQLNRDNDYFQLLNIQYTGALRLGRNEEFSGNATLQWVEQKQGGFNSSEQLLNGFLEYRHTRVFRVIGLNFRSQLQLNRRLSEAERLLQDQDTGTDVLLENTLRYRIGRLDVETELDFIKVDGRYDRLFRFKLIRSFGDL